MDILTAVNTVLPFLGEHTVTHVIGNPHPTVDIIVKAIDRARQNLLARSWWFNNYTTTLKVQSDGTIELPNKTLSVYGISQAVSIEDTRLYNLEDNSWYFTKDVKLKLTRDVSYENLPLYAALYCAYKAGEEVYVADLGLDNSVQALSTYANENMRLLHQEHMRNMRYNSAIPILMKSHSFKHARGFR